jgi:hypothetical protein
MGDNEPHSAVLCRNEGPGSPALRFPPTGITLLVRYWGCVAENIAHRARTHPFGIRIDWHRPLSSSAGPHHNQTPSLVCCQKSAQRQCPCAHRVPLRGVNCAIPTNNSFSDSFSSQQHSLTTLRVVPLPVTSQPFLCSPSSSSHPSLEADGRRPTHSRRAVFDLPPANAPV